MGHSKDHIRKITHVVYHSSNPEATLIKKKVTDIFRIVMTMFHLIHAEQRTS